MSALVIGRKSLGTFKKTLVQNGFKNIDFKEVTLLMEEEFKKTKSIDYDIVVLKTEDMKMDELKSICKELSCRGAAITLW